MLVNVQINAFLTYLESLARYTENTRQAYANDLKRFIEHLTKKLGREPEVRGCRGAPVFQGFGLRQMIEGAVDLHTAEVSGIVIQ